MNTRSPRNNSHSSWSNKRNPRTPSQALVVALWESAILKVPILQDNTFTLGEWQVTCRRAEREGSPAQYGKVGPLHAEMGLDEVRSLLKALNGTPIEEVSWIPSRHLPRSTTGKWVRLKDAINLQLHHHPGRSTPVFPTPPSPGKKRYSVLQHQPEDEDPDLHDDSSPPFIAPRPQRPRPPRKAPSKPAAPVTSDRGSASPAPHADLIHSTIDVDIHHPPSSLSRENAPPASSTHRGASRTQRLPEPPPTTLHFQPPPLPGPSTQPRHNVFVPTIYPPHGSLQPPPTGANIVDFDITALQQQQQQQLATRPTAVTRRPPPVLKETYHPPGLC
ncbi:hypothetical protein GWK47_034192 [Chionoecetes opilio]|uniref:Uncharacterized protein n=1 Tax=Chionoecetes opilio TaxID=41210 RepID=A0A8J4YIJ0_CHIOP|nr:hypothetical protein GWK47_034192 [Chionoecetes opilio]